MCILAKSCVSNLKPPLEDVKKSTVIIILFFAFVVFIITRPNPRQFKVLKGQYALVELQHDGKYLNTEQFPVLLIDNLSSGLNIGDLYNYRNPNKQVMFSKYEFKNENDKVYLILSHSSPEFLDGKYLVKIDTLQFNKKHHDFRMTFQSKSVKIVGEKSTTYLNF